jgi:two-component system, sensor histidine kinase and response regulator
MNQPNVLIVDDDTTLLEALSETLRLRMEQALIETCDSATNALERINETNHDAIVVDIKMPGMDGLQLLEEIRKLRPDVPVLLITGHGEHHLAIEALRGGAHDYIQKPIDREYFLASLSHAIQLHRLKHQVREERAALERHAAELSDCVEQRAEELRAANQTKAELFSKEQAARAALNDALERLEQSSRQREEFMLMVAHELGGPLTVITGYAQILGKRRLPREKQDRARSAILSEAHRVERLVDDLADNARAATGQFELQQHPHDLVEIVREQVEICEARSATLNAELDAPDALPVVCDRDRIAQAVSNLLTNALNYASAGKVRVQVWADDEQAHVAVADEGPGIPEDQVEAIFKPHVRLVRNGSEAPRGAGLGLHIARAIAQAHGGELSVSSIPGQGTTFTVSLPVVAPMPGSSRPA